LLRVFNKKPTLQQPRRTITPAQLPIGRVLQTSPSVWPLIKLGRRAASILDARPMVRKFPAIFGTINLHLLALHIPEAPDP
jgi:hypothetical protein